MHNIYRGVRTCFLINIYLLYIIFKTRFNTLGPIHYDIYGSRRVTIIVYSKSVVNAFPHGHAKLYKNISTNIDVIRIIRIYYTCHLNKYMDINSNRTVVKYIKRIHRTIEITMGSKFVNNMTL